MATPGRLTKVLGLPQLVFYAVGVIVGAGIYSVVGAAAGIAGSGLWISFMIGALVALLTALSYAEMATCLPQAGAEYVYLSRAFPGAGWAPFAMGIILILGGAATAATVAVAFGGYLATFVDLPPAFSGLVLLAAMSALAVVGLREAGLANAVFTSIEVGGLLIVIAAGWFGPGEQVEAPFDSGGLLPAAALIFFVYLGFEEVANLAEEVRNPGRDLPRAIIISLALTTALYVLVALSIISLVGPAEIAGNPAPLATAVERVWSGAAGLLSAIALFATANTVLITLIAGARMIFSMSRGGDFPGILGQLSSRGSPVPAAAAFLILSAALLPIADIRILAELSSFAALLAFLAVNVALIVLRYRAPMLERPFRVPLSIGRLPLLPVAGIASIIVLLASFDTPVYAGGAIAFALGIVAYWLRDRWR
ncbi:MAG: amino acid permease [Rhodobiaceae bacterium]|nr:amino acid permease [Rhodobiaceae bacterium]MCC0055479.1 amino acid permease [Rhodobiaceae bacterium]